MYGVQIRCERLVLASLSTIKFLRNRQKFAVAKIKIDKPHCKADGKHDFNDTIIKELVFLFLLLKCLFSKK